MEANADNAEFDTNDTVDALSEKLANALRVSATYLCM